MKQTVFIGSMRHLVSAEAPVDVTDATGATIRSYSVYGQVWANIRPMRQAQRFEAGQRSGVLSHVLVFRSIPGFGADWRLRLGARLFQVISFDDGDDCKGFTRAYCEEASP